MPKVVEAVYENGVLKPLEKVNLKEGEKVRVEIKTGIDHLKGKYGEIGKDDLVRLKDELHDRRNHIHR